MTNEMTAQILADADEIEFTFGSQYPAGSRARMAFHYFAEILRREFSISDKDKIELVLKLLRHVQPCTKTDLVDRLDFSRNESRRLIDLAVSSGVIEQVPEATNGRSRVLLQLP